MSDEYVEILMDDNQVAAIRIRTSMSLVLLMLRGILDKLLLFFRTPLSAERVIAKAAGGNRLKARDGQQ